MQYSELDIPASLAPFVSTVWLLSGDGTHCDHHINDALPDGCVEIINRRSGQSDWNGDQPANFVAGLCTTPAQIRMSGDGEFLGVRLWPWAWNRIGDTPCPQFHDSWLALAPGSRLANLCESEDMVISRLQETFASYLVDPIGEKVRQGHGTAAIASAAGLSPRSIQRWFKREIGMSARRYYKLLRFQRAIEHKPSEANCLAREAAELGYADQSHMSRDFRGYSKRTPKQVRTHASGPFIEGGKPAMR